jgi:hypothetical protein
VRIQKKPKPRSTLAQDRDEPRDRFVQLRFGNLASAIRDDAGVRREKPVRADSAGLVEPARREIIAIEGDGISIGPGLARDLAKGSRHRREEWPTPTQAGALCD